MISYKYKLYKSKKNKYIEAMLREASFVWNHALNLQKRYYSIYGKYITSARMQKHFSKRIRRKLLHSQTVQELLQRLDTAYTRFFKRLAKRPPKCRKGEYISSIVFKQGGYSLDENSFTIKRLKKTFRFSFSREYKGNVKQVRIKKNALNELFIIIVTDYSSMPISKSRNGASIGIDFGLKTYMTISDGTVINNPLFLKQSLKKLAKAKRQLSHKENGSNHRNRAKKSVAKIYDDIVNKRTDFQWKLAHHLCKMYDTIFIEDLNISGMSRLWGRKINDLAHANFINILEEVALKYSITVHKIDRWFPSSKLCNCGYKNTNLTLRDRKWVCPQCGEIHKRDLHASEMILRRGIYELGSGKKTNLGFYEGAIHAITQESNLF